MIRQRNVHPLSALGEFYYQKRVDFPSATPVDAAIGLIFDDCSKIIIYEIGQGVATITGTSAASALQIRERTSAVIPDLEDIGSTGWTQSTVLLASALTAGLFQVRNTSGIVTLRPRFLNANNRGRIQMQLFLDLFTSAGNIVWNGNFWMRGRAFAHGVDE